MDIQTKDGILLRNIPDGTPEEQVKARIATIRQERVLQQKQPEKPTLMNLAFGDTTAGQYLKGRETALKSVLDPQTWKNLYSDLTKPLPKVMEGGKLKIEDIPESEKQKYNDEAINLVSSVNPFTGLGKTAGSFIKKAVTGPTRNAAIDVAADAGFHVPRSNIKPSFWTNLGERFGGKQAIEATAQAKNQPVINKLAARSLGIADDVTITPELLKKIRENAGQAYEAVKNVGVLSTDNSYKTALKELKTKFSGASNDFPELVNAEVSKLANALNKKTITSEGAIEMVKNLREAAKSNLRPIASSQDKLLGKAQRKASEILEDLIERNIQPKLGKDMLDAYRNARKLIAKTYTVEGALVGENVSGRHIAKAGSKIKLEDELKKISEFSTAFPRLTRVELGSPASGGLFEPMVYGTAGSIASGPLGAAAAAFPIIGKPIARHLMTTVPKKNQKILADILEKELAQRGIQGAGLSLDK